MLRQSCIIFFLFFCFNSFAKNNNPSYKTDKKEQVTRFLNTADVTGAAKFEQNKGQYQAPIDVE